MATNNRYTPYSVKVDAALYHITQGSLNPNTTVQLYTPNGAVDPTGSSIIGQSPVFRFSTTDVGAALTAIGLDGLDVSTALEMGWAARKDGGAIEPGAGKKESAAKCFIVPEALTVNQDGDAELSFIGYGYSADGSSAILAHADTLSSGTPTIGAKFTLGTVTVGGVALKKEMGYTLEFGTEVRLYKDSGKLYPTSASIVARRPVLSVNLADMVEVTASSMLGTEVSTIVANIVARSTTGGGLAGAGNKTISFEKALALIEQAGGSHMDDSMATWRAEVRKGAGAIWVLG